jgi:hypothetical protein
MSELKEAIEQAVDESLNAIRYNLVKVFQGLLYSLQLENEKQGGVGDIEELIGLILRTSKYDGPEGEEYPVWIADDRLGEDPRKIQAKKILKRLETVLLKHGIEQAWNIGRNGLNKKNAQEKT